MEGRYRGLMEAAPDAMVVVNQSGEIVLLNVQAEKQFGYRRDELLGQKVTNIIPDGFAERLIADDLRSTEDALAQQIGTGIELIAISTDDAAGLKQSIDNYQDGPIPFPLVTDAPLEVFKAYRCYDDFEKQPLHGTFFIDGQGLVRWQDISYQPFEDTKFLLGEAQRLLNAK